MSRIAESDHLCSQVQCLKAVTSSNQGHFSYRANTKLLYKDKPYEKSNTQLALFYLMHKNCKDCSLLSGPPVCSAAVE